LNLCSGVDTIPYRSRFELYNLNNDISEGSDLSEKYADKVDDLHAKLNIHLEEVGAKIPY
jgi:hypothetical protein